MTRRALQQFKGTLVRVPELLRPKDAERVRYVPDAAKRLKTRLEQHNRRYLTSKRLETIDAYAVKRAYSFAGYQRSTKILTFFKNKQDTRFAAKYKKHSGRCLQGTVTVYSKGYRASRRVTNYTKNLNMLFGFVSALKIYRDPNSFKLTTIYVTSSGTLIALPLTSRTHYQNLVMAAGTYIFIRRVVGYAIIQKLALCQQLRLLRFHRAISYVAIDVNKRVTLAKSSGTRVMTMQKNKKTGADTTLIKMPSGKIRFISSYIIVLLGYIKPKNKKTFRNSRAGYWRNIGFRPTVRGIVKNSVDHPHGGRAKTVLWPRTPWGKSTK